MFYRLKKSTSEYQVLKSELRIVQRARALKLPVFSVDLVFKEELNLLLEISDF